MKTEFTIGKLQSEATEIQDYHRQSSVGTISESLQEGEADTIRVRQSKKDHVYAVSDDQGTLLVHYRYTAFDEPEIYSLQTGNKLAGSAIANPVLWNSRRYDEQTDFYYYYRHYKTDIGRCLGRDPIEEKGGVNLYSLLFNSPLDWWYDLGNPGTKKEGVDKLPKHMKPDNKNTFAGGLPASLRNPNIGGKKRKVVKHWIEVKWNCCSGTQATNSNIVDWGETK